MAIDTTNYEVVDAHSQLVISGGNVQARTISLHYMLQRYIDSEKSPVRIYVVGKGGHAFGQLILRGLKGPFEQECVYTKRYSDANKPVPFEILYYTGSRLHQGYRIVVVDDLLDTGETQHCLATHFTQSGAKEVKALTLLDKVSKHDPRFPVEVLAVGFEIADFWAYGEGMDAFGHDPLRFKLGVWCLQDEEVPDPACWLPSE